MSVKAHEAYCLDSAQDRLLFYDDFLGDSLRDLWAAAGDAGGGVAVVDTQDGGVVRITTDGDDDDYKILYWGDIRSLLVSKKVTMEFRLKLTQTTIDDFYFGLYNSVTQRIGWYASPTNIFIRCRDAGGDAAFDSGIDTDTDYHIYRIECFPAGEVHFYYDGVETANSPITTNITALHCQPRFYLRTGEDVTKTMDIDYVWIRQDR